MMDVYIINSPAEIPAGSVLSLTEGQAVPRRAVLKPLGEGVYEATGALSFKAGERIGYQGDLPKSWADKLEPEGGVKPKARKPKAPAG